MELTYELRRAIRETVGPQAAAIFDVLAHNDTGDGGVEITTKLLSRESGLSPKTVQRVIAALVEGGLVKCEKRFLNNRQVANRYHLYYDRVGVGRTDSPAGQADRPIGTTSHLEVVEKPVVSNSVESVVMPGGAMAGEGLRPSVAPSSPGEMPEADTGNLHRDEGLGAPVGASGMTGTIPVYRWPPRNSPMPLPIGGPKGGGRRFLDIHDSALWLVSYFEGHVVERDSRVNAAKGRKPVDEVGESRKIKWFRNSYELVSRHPMREVVEVIDWLFGTLRGYVPSWIAESSQFRWDGKVTHIQQVQEHYDSLREAMTSGVEPSPLDEQAAARRSPKVNYGEPFADPLEEAKVSELVALFTEFRLTVGPCKEIHSSRTWRWAKSFRLALGHHGHDFDEVKMVVTALRDQPEMDRTRYPDPFNMYQRREWEHLVAAARLAQLKAERKAASGDRGGRLERQQAAHGDWTSMDSDDEPEPRFLDMSARRLRPLDYYGSKKLVDGN